MGLARQIVGRIAERAHFPYRIWFVSLPIRTGMPGFSQAMGSKLAGYGLSSLSKYIMGMGLNSIRKR